MQIEWDGKKYDWDPIAGIGVAEMMVIHRHTGYGHKSFTHGISEGEPLCLQAFLWALKRYNGEKCAIDHLDFSVPAFYEAIEEGSNAETSRLLDIEIAKAVSADKAGKKPNPSRPAAKKQGKRTRTSATTATPTSSASPPSAT